MVEWNKFTAALARKIDIDEEGLLSLRYVLGNLLYLIIILFLIVYIPQREFQFSADVVFFFFFFTQIILLIRRSLIARLTNMPS